MIRSLSITSLAFTSSLIVATLLAGSASAEKAAVQRGQWPSVDAGAAKPSDGKGPTAKPAAANPTRKAPEKLTPAGKLDALTGLSMSRDGKSRSMKVPGRLRGMILKGQGAAAIQEAPKPGKLVAIKDTTQYPYTAVGLLSNGCSGTLIGKRFVLTAAYCIYNLETKQWDQNLDFYPGINGNSRPFDGVQWKNAWVTKGFAEEGNWELAFGLVELQSDVGDQNGWFGYGHVPQFPKGPAMTGYPAGVPDFTMWETTCPVKAADKAFIAYNCPLKKPLEGMAGAAIWMVDKGSSGPMVVAIHGGPLKGADLWGQRINEETFYTLQAWMKAAEDGGEVAGDDTQGDEDTPGDEVDPDDTQADEEEESQAPKKP
ncbi:trypsin-like serine peptidase [Taklimakanibacter deserti]|uniref:trypsin-like serine peptidase n=1 Tax=Taklimakanibacter deserti TaxID=2267839 RepID=UPI000E651EBA